VNLEAVYPDYNDPSREICLEELRAAHRGWLAKDWSKSDKALQEIPTNAASRIPERSEPFNEIIDHGISDGHKSSHQGDRENKLSKVKKFKVREINETQTGKFISFS